MTCIETRDLFSALADDALTPEERAALDAHLADCAECRRELATFARTVKMVRAMDPAHAPAGFVDRVLAAAEPVPWSRRVARRVFRPWPTVPLSAAALLVIGGLAVLLFRALPEQQRLARQQYQAEYQPQPAPQQPPARPAGPGRPAAPTASREGARGTEPAPAAKSAPPTEPTQSTDEARVTEQARPTEPASRATPAPPAARDALSDSTRTDKSESRTAAEPSRLRAQTSAPTAKRAEPSSPPTTEAPAPPAGTADTQRAAPPGTGQEPGTTARAFERDEAKDDAKRAANVRREAAAIATVPSQAPPQIAPLSRTGPMTGTRAAPPDVTAELRTADVRAAERSLIALAARVGGRQTGRRIDGGRVVVELAVPSDAYAEFVRRAAALGPVAIDKQAIERSVLAIAVTISD
jgi:Putative zinc-finger